MIAVVKIRLSLMRMLFGISERGAVIRPSVSASSKAPHAAIAAILSLSVIRGLLPCMENVNQHSRRRGIPYSLAPGKIAMFPEPQESIPAYTGKFSQPKKKHITTTAYPRTYEENSHILPHKKVW